MDVLSADEHRYGWRILGVEEALDPVGLEGSDLLCFGTVNYGVEVLSSDAEGDALLRDSISVPDAQIPLPPEA